MHVGVLRVSCRRVLAERLGGGYWRDGVGAPPLHSCASSLMLSKLSLASPIKGRWGPVRLAAPSTSFAGSPFPRERGGSQRGRWEWP